ncbi:beta-ketoacyl synthase N-terminal-like domain-containing protein [Hymenobacter saemangeumensis]|uniref:Beta-ketoacyl synthase N-terminal-like domain-containing protein n=1 Tax=Hymenobacter saemangeumensis TaxID=1084522 RepID=A0ABP8ISV5_9BACT
MAFVAAHNIISPLGTTSAATFEAVLAGRSGVAACQDLLPDQAPVWASRLSPEWHDDQHLEQPGRYTKFEKMLLASITDALRHTSVDAASPRTLFVFSSTKGNIGLLEGGQPGAARVQRASLPYSAQLVSAYFKNPATPVVLSNACISGVTALLYAQRLLRSGAYDAAIVAGADTVSRFVVSGFQAFQALCAAPCKPYSEDRTGINLGEAAATLILMATAPESTAGTGLVRVAGGAVTNDANHISGPSRTGAELAHAISSALSSAQVSPAQVDFISGHGTATIYNDEMEAKAFALAGLRGKPLHSVKGALGHTLGAAGLVESALSIMALTQGRRIPTAGYSQPMTAAALNVSAQPEAASSRWALKTASGFGGCNGALLFERI